MNRWQKIGAEVVSRILDPMLEIPVAVLFAVYIAVREGLRWRFLGILMFVDMLMPLIFFLIMLYHKQITSWDVRERRQRIPWYFFTMICHLGGVWLARELGKTELYEILLVFWLTGVVFAGITVFWKISLHAGVNAVLATVINIYLGWQYWYLYLLVILVSWVRVYQKHHTWAQVAAGALIGGGMVGVGLSLSVVK